MERSTEVVKDKLLIFDMDGTLFDTSESNYCAYKDAADAWGYKLDRDTFMNVFVGKNYKEFLPMFGIKSREELIAIHDYKKANYKKYIRNIRKNNELFALINDLRCDAIIALATTASKDNTMEVLRYFGVEDCFEFILTQEDVLSLKPDPECYIKTMKMVGISGERTLIFEDSLSGIDAAISSGAGYIRVNNFQTLNFKIKSNDYLRIEVSPNKEDVISGKKIRFLDYFYYLLFDNGFYQLIDEIRKKLENSMGKNSTNEYIIVLDNYLKSQNVRYDDLKLHSRNFGGILEMIEEIFNKNLFYILIFAPQSEVKRYCDIFKHVLQILDGTLLY